MNHNLKLVFLCSLVLVFGGFVMNASTPDRSRDKGYESINFITAWLKERKVCSSLLRENEILLPDQDKEVAECFIKAVSQMEVDLGDDFNKRDDLVNYITDRVMLLDIRDELLSKMVEKTANGAANYIEIIKQLVNKGASTNNVFAGLISEHNFSACETTEFIIENNKGFNKKDIFSMTWEGGNKIVCVNAVEKFLTFNPESINLSDNQGDTALHLLLLDISTNVHTKLALQLMSKTNVNMQNNRGNTALHGLILYNYRNGSDRLKLYHEVFNKFVQLGGDLDLKNNEGITIRELLVKYSLKIPKSR